VTHLAGILAAFCAGLFAGAAAYITFVEQPVRLRDTPAIALTEWRPRYPRAAGMQASLAVVGALGGLWRWWEGGGLGWLFGSLLLGAVVPITLVVILPTNRRLFDPSLPADAPEARQLLARWGRLHAIRTGLSLAAFVLFLALLTR
jgi:Anthrone oxygenase